MDRRRVPRTPPQRCSSVSPPTPQRSGGRPHASCSPSVISATTSRLPRVRHVIESPREVVETFRDTLTDLRSCVCVRGRLWTATRAGQVVVRDRRCKVLAVVDEVDRCGHVLALHCSGDCVWAGYSLGVIKVYDHRTVREVDGGEFRRHSGAVTCFAGYGKYVFSGSLDFQILQWDAVTLEFVKQFSGHAAGVRCLLSRGHYLYTGSDDGTLRMWHTGEAEACRRVVAHQGGVKCIAHTVEVVWTGGDDGGIQVWDAVSCEPIATLNEHTGAVTCLLHLGKEMWSGGNDKLICCWDTSTYHLTRRVNQHSGFIACMAKVVAHREIAEVWSSGGDRVVHVWGWESPVDSDECQQLREDLAMAQQSFQEQHTALYNKYLRMEAAKDSHIAELNNTIARQADDLYRCGSINVDLQKVLVEKEREIDDRLRERWEGVNKQLERELAAAREAESLAVKHAAEVASQAARVPHLEEAMRTMEDRLEACKAELEEMDSRCVQMRVEHAQQIAKAEAELRTTAQELADSQSRLSAKQAMLTDLAKSLEEAESALALSKGETLRVTCDLDRVKGELATKDDEIQRLSASSERLRAQLEETRQVQDGLRGQMEQQAAAWEKQRKADLMAEATAEASQRRRAERLEKELDEVRTRLEAEKQRLQEMLSLRATDLEESEAKLAALHSEFDHAMERNKEVEKRLHDEVLQLRQQIAQERADHTQQLKEQLEKMSADVVERSKVREEELVMEEHRRHLNELQIEDLLSKVSRLEAALEKAEGRVEELDVQNNALLRRAEAAEEEIQKRGGAAETNEGDVMLELVRLKSVIKDKEARLAEAQRERDEVLERPLKDWSGEDRHSTTAMAELLRERDIALERLTAVENEMHDVRQSSKRQMDQLRLQYTRRAEAQAAAEAEAQAALERVTELEHTLRQLRREAGRSGDSGVSEGRRSPQVDDSAKLVSAEMRAEGLVRELSRQVEDRKLLEQELESLRARLETLPSEDRRGSAERHRRVQQQMEEEREKAEEEKRRMGERIRSLKQQLAQEQEAKESAEDEREVIAGKLRHLKQQIELERDERQTAEDERDKLQRQCDRETRQKRRLLEEVKELTESSHQLRKQLEATKWQATKSRVLKEGEGCATDELNVALEMQRVQRLRSEELEEENRHLQNEVVRLQEELREARETAQAEVARREQIAQELAVLRRDCDQATFEADVLRKKVQQMRAGQGKEEDIMERLRAEEQVADALRQELRDVQRHRLAEGDESQLERQLQEARKTTQKLHDHVRRLEGELAHERSTASEALEELREELRRLQRRELASMPSEGGKGEKEGTAVHTVQDEESRGPAVSNLLHDLEVERQAVERLEDELRRVQRLADQQAQELDRLRGVVPQEEPFELRDQWERRPGGRDVKVAAGRADEVLSRVRELEEQLAREKEETASLRDRVEGKTGMEPTALWERTRELEGQLKEASLSRRLSAVLTENDSLRTKLRQYEATQEAAPAEPSGPSDTREALRDIRERTLQEEVDTLQAQLVRTQRERDVHGTEADSLRSEVAKLKQSREAAAPRIPSAMPHGASHVEPEEPGELRREREQARAECERLLNEVVKVQALLEREKQVTDSLRAELRQSRVEGEEVDQQDILREELRRSDAEKEQLRKEAVELRRQLKEHLERVLPVEGPAARGGEPTAAAAEDSRHHLAYQEQSASARDELRAAQADLEDKATECDRLREEVITLRSQLKSGHGEVHEDSKTEGRLLSHPSEDRSETERKLRESLASEKQAVEVLRQELQAAQREEARLRAEVADLRSSLHGALQEEAEGSDRTSLHEELLKARNEATDLRKQIKSLEVRHQKTAGIDKDEIARLREMLEWEEKAADTLREELQASQKAQQSLRQQFRAERESLREEVAELERRLDQEQQACDTLRFAARRHRSLEKDGETETPGSDVQGEGRAEMVRRLEEQEKEITRLQGMLSEREAVDAFHAELPHGKVVDRQGDDTAYPSAAEEVTSLRRGLDKTSDADRYHDEAGALRAEEEGPLLRKEIRRLQEELRESTGSCEALRGRVAVLTEALQQHKEAAEGRAAPHDIAEQQQSPLLAEREVSDALRAEVVLSGEERRETQQQHETAHSVGRDEVARLRERLREEEQEADALRRKLHEGEKEQAELIKQLQEERESLAAEGAELRELLSREEKANAALREEAQTAREETEKGTRKADRICETLQQTEEEVEVLRDELRRMRADHQALREHMHTEQEALLDELSQARRSFEESEQTCDALRAELRNSTDRGVGKAAGGVGKEPGERTVEASPLLEEVAVLRRQLEKQEQEADVLRFEVREYRRQLSEGRADDDETRRLQALLQEEEGVSDALRAELRVVRKQLEALRRQQLASIAEGPTQEEPESEQDRLAVEVRVKELQSELDSERQQADALRSELRELRRLPVDTGGDELHSPEDQTAELRKQLGAEQERSKMLEGKILEVMPLADEVRRLQQQLELEQEAADLLRERLQRGEGESKDDLEAAELRREVAVLRCELEKWCPSYGSGEAGQDQSHSEQLVRLQRQMEQREEDSEALREQCHALEAQVEKLTAEADDLRRLADEQEDELNRHRSFRANLPRDVEEELDRLQEELQMGREELAQAREEIADRDEEISALKRDKQTPPRIAVGRVVESSSKSDEVRALMGEVQTLTDTIAHRDDTIRKLREQIEKGKAPAPHIGEPMLERERARADDAEARMRTLEDFISDLQEGSLQEGESSEVVARLREELRDVERRLQEQLESERKASDELAGELGRARTEAATLRGLLDEEQRAADALREEMRRAKRKLSEVASAVPPSEKADAERQRTEAALRSELAKQEEEADSLREEVRQLKRRVLSAEATPKDKELDSLRTKLELSLMKEANLTKELERLRRPRDAGQPKVSTARKGVDEVWEPSQPARVPSHPRRSESGDDVWHSAPPSPTSAGEGRFAPQQEGLALDDLQSKLTEARGKAAQLEEELTAVREALEKSERERDAARKEAAAARSKGVADEESISLVRHEAEVGEWRARHVALEEAVDDLQKQLSEAHHEVVHHKLRADDFRHIAKQMTAKADEAEDLHQEGVKEVEALQRECEALRQEQERLIAALQAKAQRVQELETHVDGLEKRSFEDGIGRSTRVDDLERELDAAKEHSSHLRRSVAEFKSRNMALTLDKTALADRVADLSGQVTSLRDRLAEAEDQLAEAKSAKDTAEKKADEAQRAKEEAEKKATAATAHAVKMKEENEALEAEADDLRRQVDGAHGPVWEESNELAGQLKDRTEELHRLSDELQTQIRENFRLRNRIDELEEGAGGGLTSGEQATALQYIARLLESQTKEIEASASVINDLQDEKHQVEKDFLQLTELVESMPGALTLEDREEFVRLQKTFQEEAARRLDAKNDELQNAVSRLQAAYSHILSLVQQQEGKASKVAVSDVEQHMRQIEKASLSKDVENIALKCVVKLLSEQIKTREKRYRQLKGKFAQMVDISRRQPYDYYKPTQVRPTGEVLTDLAELLSALQLAREALTERLLQMGAAGGLQVHDDRRSNVDRPQLTRGGHGWAVSEITMELEGAEDRCGALLVKYSSGLSDLHNMPRDVSGPLPIVSPCSTAPPRDPRRETDDLGSVPPPPASPHTPPPWTPTPRMAPTRHPPPHPDPRVL